MTFYTHMTDSKTPEPQGLSTGISKKNLVAKQLAEAILGENTNQIDVLISRNLARCVLDGGIALHAAVSKGNVKVVGALLEKQGAKYEDLFDHEINELDVISYAQVLAQGGNEDAKKIVLMLADKSNDPNIPAPKRITSAGGRRIILDNDGPNLLITR